MTRANPFRRLAETAERAGGISPGETTSRCTRVREWALFIYGDPLFNGYRTCPGYREITVCTLAEINAESKSSLSGRGRRFCVQSINSLEV